MVLSQYFHEVLKLILSKMRATIRAELFWGTMVLKSVLQLAIRLLVVDVPFLK